MAYTTIQDAAVSVDATLDSALLTALRDNGKAINQAESGAPKIQMVALDESINDGSANTLTGFFPTTSNKTDIGSDNLITSIEFYNGNLLQTRYTGNPLTSLGYTFRGAGSYNISVAAGAWYVTSVVVKLFRNGSLFFTSQSFTPYWDNVPDSVSVDFDVGDVLTVTADGPSSGVYYNAMAWVHSSNSFFETTGIGQVNRQDASGYAQFYRASAFGINDA